jgi:hypothetical protein
MEKKLVERTHNNVLFALGRHGRAGTADRSHPSGKAFRRLHQHVDERKLEAICSHQLRPCPTLSSDSIADVVTNTK